MAWAAHKRSAFIGEILDYRSDSQFTFIKGDIISDLQVSYEFTDGWFKGLSALFQAHNLTNAPFQATARPSASPRPASPWLPAVTAIPAATADPAITSSRMRTTSVNTG